MVCRPGYASCALNARWVRQAMSIFVSRFDTRPGEDRFNPINSHGKRGLRTWSGECISRGGVESALTKVKAAFMENVHTQNPLWVDRIEAAVNSALAGKGWTQVESGGSVAIMATEVTKDHQSLSTFYDGLGGGWGWRGWFGGGFGEGFGDSTTTENTYQVGTLVVDLFDSNTKKLIWRGSASDTLSDKSDTNIKNPDKGVEKMFDHFPPDARRGRL